MSIKARYRSGNIEYYESTTQQVVHATAPVLFRHQFHGHTLDETNTWTAIQTGTASDQDPVLVDGVGGGVCSLPLDSTSEEQTSAIYMNNIRTFDLNASLVCEFRAQIVTLPTLLSDITWGMAGDYNKAVASITELAVFKVDGSGALLIDTDDTTNDERDTATATTLVAGTNYVFRIDCRTLSDVKFFVNGARQAPATTFDMSNLTTAEAMMQPLGLAYKSTGAGLGVIYISDVTIWGDATA